MTVEILTTQAIYEGLTFKQFINKCIDDNVLLDNTIESLYTHYNEAKLQQESHVYFAALTNNRDEINGM